MLLPSLDLSFGWGEMASGQRRRAQDCEMGRRHPCERSRGTLETPGPNRVTVLLLVDVVWQSVSTWECTSARSPCERASRRLVSSGAVLSMTTNVRIEVREVLVHPPSVALPHCSAAVRANDCVWRAWAGHDQLSLDFGLFHRRLCLDWDAGGAPHSQTQTPLYHVLGALSAVEARLVSWRSL